MGIDHPVDILSRQKSLVITCLSESVRNKDFQGQQNSLIIIPFLVPKYRQCRVLRVLEDVDEGSSEKEVAPVG